MNPLIRLYNFHKKEFGVEDNTFLRLFGKLLSTHPSFILECCAQISPQGTHGTRFRLGYEQQDIQEGLHTIYDFVRRIGECENVNLNYDIQYQVINNNLNVSKIIAMGVGLNYKKNSSDSKIKYYFKIREYTEKIDQVISLHPPLDGIGDYLIHDEFMFGINMYFDGRTSLEIYPLFYSQDLNNAALMGKLKLQDAIGRFIEKCNLLYVYVSFEDSGNRVLHFFPQSPTQFVRLLNNRQLSLAYSSVQILNYLLNHSYHKEAGVILSLKENEILSEDIQNINLQYGLSSRA